MNLYSLFKSRKGAIDTANIAAIITAIGFAGILGTLLNQDINDAERQKHFESAQVLTAAAAKMVVKYANHGGAAAGSFSFAGGIPVSSLNTSKTVNGKTAQWLNPTTDSDTSLISLQGLLNFDADSPLVRKGADPSQIGVEGLVNEPAAQGGTRIYHPQGTAVQITLICDKEGDAFGSAPCSTVYEGTDTYMEIADMNVVDVQAKVNLVGAKDLVLSNFTTLTNPHAAAVNSVATFSGTLNSDLSEVTSIKMSYLKMFDARDDGHDQDEDPGSAGGCDAVTDIFQLPVCFLGNTGFFSNDINLTQIDDDHLANKRLTVSSNAYFNRSSLPSDMGPLNVVSPLDVGNIITDAGTRTAVQTSAVVDPNEEGN